MKPFNIKEPLALGSVSRDKTPKSILTYKNGVVSYTPLDNKPKLGSWNLMSSDAIYKAVRDGVTNEFQSIASSGTTALQNLQSATTIGNYTNRGIEFRNTDNSNQATMSVDDATGHLKANVDANKRFECNGDVVAYGDGTSPGGSWWDDIPVDGVTIHLNGSGDLEVIGGGGGVSDHGALSGLSDDDHTQYHNNTRGDLRYSLLSHNHSGVYEPVFTKNSAFNKPFGVISGQVAEGDHDHSGIYEPVFSKNTAFNKNFAGTGSATTVSKSDHTHTESDITDLDKFWTKTGNDVYYNSGDVMIGATTQQGTERLLVAGGDIRCTGDIIAYAT